MAYKLIAVDPSAAATILFLPSSGEIAVGGVINGSVEAVQAELSSFYPGQYRIENVAPESEEKAARPAARRKAAEDSAN